MAVIALYDAAVRIRNAHGGVDAAATDAYHICSVYAGNHVPATRTFPFAHPNRLLSQLHPTMQPPPIRKAIIPAMLATAPQPGNTLRIEPSTKPRIAL